MLFLSELREKLSGRLGNQILGIIILLAISGLILPWLLTPDFSLKNQESNDIEKIIDPPKEIILNDFENVPENFNFVNDEELVPEKISRPLEMGKKDSFVIQVGAFSEEKNAQKRVKQLKKNSIVKVYSRQENDVIRIFIGPIFGESEAKKLGARVSEDLSITPVIQRYDVRRHGRK